MFARVALAFVDVAHGRLVQRKASQVSWKAATLFREVVVPQLAGGTSGGLWHRTHSRVPGPVRAKKTLICRLVVVKPPPRPQGSMLSFRFVGGLWPLRKKRSSLHSRACHPGSNIELGGCGGLGSRRTRWQDERFFRTHRKEKMIRAEFIGIRWFKRRSGCARLSRRSSAPWRRASLSKSWTWRMRRKPARRLCAPTRFYAPWVGPREHRRRGLRCNAY